MSHNPFEIIDARLSNIEGLLLDLKHNPKAEKPNLSEEEYITRKEACEILGISLPTISLWQKNGIIPAYRIGTRVRYKRAEVVASMKKVKSSN